MADALRRCARALRCTFRVRARQNRRVRADCRLVQGGGLRYEDTMRNESIDRLARRLAESLPESLRAVRDDMEQNFRSVLRNGLAKLDLVTREEFEVQEAILARAREQHTRLEERLAALEAKLAAAEAASVVAPAESGTTGTKANRVRKKKTGEAEPPPE